jgi:hypothetical protein
MLKGCSINRRLMTHAEIIDGLGGTVVVANHFGLTAAAVSFWKSRGIAWEYRPAIAELAKDKALELPADFFTPKKRKAA